MSITRAGRIRKCKNTEFVWELREAGFCESGRKKSYPLARVSIRKAFSVVSFDSPIS